MGKVRKDVCAAWFLIGIGLVLVVIGVFGHIYINSAIKNGIDSSILIQPRSADPTKFDKWVTPYDPTDTPRYVYYHLWNLTNPTQVLAGQTPVYKDVGPFVYRKYITKVDVQFQSSDTEVSYRELTQYVYEPSLSSTAYDGKQTKITTMNPAYLGILLQAGGEAKLMVAVGQGLLSKALGAMGQVFSQVLINNYLNYMSHAPVPTLISSVNDFCKQWTSQQIAFGGLFLKTQSVPYGYELPDTTSGISVQTCLNLFNSSYPKSLTSTPGAVYWLQMKTGYTAADLVSEFGLSVAQYKTVMQWLGAVAQPTTANNNTVAATYIPRMFKANGVDTDTLADVEYYQFCTKQALGGQSVLTYVSALGVEPELSTALSNFTYCKALFSNSQTSLAVLQGYGLFLTLAASIGTAPTTVKTYYGIDLTAAEIGAIALHLQNLGVDTLKGLFAQGSGLFVSWTVDDWLFNAQDILLKTLTNGAKSAASLFTNYTSIAETSAASTYYTGKGDIDLAGWYKNYHGNQYINIWKSPQLVHGSDGSYYGPGKISSSSVPGLFVSELMRYVPFIFEKNTQIYDISMIQFRPSPSLFAVNPTFYQSFPYVANMTSDHDGIPIFVTKPHMKDTQSSLANGIVGNHPTADMEVFLDIEPITGAAMSVGKKLQVNLYISSSYSLLDLPQLGHTNIKKGILYPVVWGDETSTLTSSDADKFKKNVIQNQNLSFALLLVGTMVGGLLFVVGILQMIMVKKSDAVVQSSSQTQPINSSAEQRYAPSSRNGWVNTEATADAQYENGDLETQPLREEDED